MLTRRLFIAGTAACATLPLMGLKSSASPQALTVTGAFKYGDMVIMSGLDGSNYGKFIVERVKGAAYELSPLIGGGKVTIHT